MSNLTSRSIVKIDLEKSALTKLDRFIAVKKDKLGFALTRSQALEYLINKSVEADIKKREMKP